MLLIGSAWVFGLWQYAKCDEAPDPCGAPAWLDTTVSVAVIAAVAVLVICLLLTLGERARSPGQT